MPIERVIYEVIKNLKKNNIKGIELSKSHRKNTGIMLDNVNEKEIQDYISQLKTQAYFHNTAPAKDSWHQINRMFKPIFNAGIIELCKYLPYLPGLDKNSLYKKIGIKIGKNTTIAPRVQFDYFHPELIEIGENCLIGDNVKIWAHDYGLGNFMIGTVKIGDNVKIGSEAIIGPATEIGDNSQIDFGSFLYSSKIPSNAKVIRKERSNYVRAY